MLARTGENPKVVGGNLLDLEANELADSRRHSPPKDEGVAFMGRGREGAVPVGAIEGQVLRELGGSPGKQTPRPQEERQGGR
jgi:hypothetical protein